MIDIRRYFCFPQTYSEGRKWFTQAVDNVGGKIERFVNPHALGPDGEELSTDVAMIGDPFARKIFLSISGTHGQEYFCGAATQLNWLVGEGPKTLPKGIAVCLVHAHNPYGAAHFSRANENYVDLNRNYLDNSKPLRPNPYYRDVHELLFTDDMDAHILDEVMERFDDYMENTDPHIAMTALGGGQNTHPTGMIYCGESEQWSTTTIKAVVSKYLTHAEKVAIIDWHTGLGSFGEASLLMDLPSDTEEYRWGCAWWGKPQNTDAIYDAGVMPEFVGHVNDGIANDLRQYGVTVANTVIEFGTVDNRTVIPALLIDRWLRFKCRDLNAPHAVAMRVMMMERFNPSQYPWRRSVLDKSARYYANTIRGLNSWGT